MTTELKEDEQFVYRYNPVIVDVNMMYEDPEGEYIKYEYHKDVVVAGMWESIDKLKEVNNFQAQIIGDQEARIKELEKEVKAWAKEWQGLL